jgi:hypothetical protein
MNTLDWLLASDPSIRWQAMRDLTSAPAEEVAAERAGIATEGWGARLLALRRDDGQWDTGTPGPEWPTLLALLMLRDMGLDPSSEEARDAIALPKPARRGTPRARGRARRCSRARSSLASTGAYLQSARTSGST